MTGQSAWHPTSDQVARAHVTRLAQELGLADYDALYRFSVERPDAYWRHLMGFLGIVWSRPYETYCDTSEGAPFPRWFVGGELNWTNSVFAWGVDPAIRDRAAVIAERENGAVSTLSYGDLPSRVTSFAAGLARLGVRRGDRVGLLMEGGIEAVVSFLGISCLGAVAVPLFTGFGVDAIVSRLSSCSARALITTSGFDRRGNRIDVFSLVEEARERLPQVDVLVLKQADGAPVPAGWTDWHAVHAEPDASLPMRMAPDDPMMVVYTSGTTGKPKGAVHSHGGFPLKIAHDAAVHFDIGPGDVFCWPADMGWIAGSLVLASALMRGATLVCYDGAPDFPDWSRMGRLVERHRVTHFGSSPTMIRGLAANEAAALAADLSSVRLLVTAGERIDPEHFVWYQNVFGGGRCPVINYTGGTEVSGGLLSNVPVKPITPSGFASVSPSIRAEVLDEEGRPVRDRIGELALLAPFVGMTNAFWQDRERYLETYWSRFPEVWIHGDLALRTADGVFFILGRSDDTLKVAGKRLGPSEVEEVLLELPEVREVAAIGIDDPVKGQKLVIFVVSSGEISDERAFAREAARHVEHRLGKPFRPGRVHVVSQLPKTRSSKIMRRVVRSVYTGQAPGDLSALENPGAIEEIRAAAVG